MRFRVRKRLRTQTVLILTACRRSGENVLNELWLIERELGASLLDPG